MTITDITPPPGPLLSLGVSVLQKLLIAGGTWLVDHGYTTQTDAAQFETAGVALALIGAAWGLWNRVQAYRVARAAHNAGLPVAAIKKAPLQPVEAGIMDPRQATMQKQNR